jgi:meiotic recombination protein REC8, fungi type
LAFRLAATLGPKSNAKRLNRKDLYSISVPDTCAFLAAPPSPLSLRLSANLMIGVSRVYGQQWQYHMSDVQGLCTKLSHVNTPANPEAIDLSNNEK